MSNPVLDGASTFIQGVSSAVEPELLSEQSLSRGRNITLRGGKAQPRPPFSERGLVPGHVLNGVAYSPLWGGVIILVTDGQFYVGKPTAVGVTWARLSGSDRNNAFLPVSIAHTPNFVVVTNAQDKSWIYDGISLRRATEEEVPPASVIRYGNGRLWAARGDRLYAGDIYNSSEPGSELKFTEISYLSGGGYLSMPGVITAMEFIPVADTTTGFGSLIVFGNSWARAVRAEIFEREAWAQTPRFVSDIFGNVGCVGPSAIAQVNQDLYWRSGEGELRSFRQAVIDYQGPGNSGMSREVSWITDNETPWALESSSCVFFDNRLLFLASPYLNYKRQWGHKDIVALDFAPISTMHGKSNPVFDGEWDGVDFQTLFTGGQRCFGVSSHDDGNMRMWEIGRTISKRKPVVSTLETKRFTFGVGDLKKLQTCSISISDFDSEIAVQVFFRPDYYQPWTLWGEKRVSAKSQYEAEVRISDPVSDLLSGFEDENGGSIIAYLGPNRKLPRLLRQYRSGLIMLSPPDEENPNSNRLSVFGHQFQIKLVVIGSRWKLDWVKLKAIAVPDRTTYAMEEDDVIYAVSDASVAETFFREPVTQVPLYTDFTDRYGKAYSL